MRHAPTPSARARPRVGRAALVIAMACAFTLAGITTASAADITSGDFTYTLSGGDDATITGLATGNTDTDITIPDKLDGHDVTAIGDKAFQKKSLKKVTIPDSVTTISESAFYDNQLTKVTIGDSVTTIGNYAFQDNQLTQVTIGDKVTTIGYVAFYDNQLTEITIPDSVTSIGESAFANNPGLVAVLMAGKAPTSVTGATATWPSFGKSNDLTVYFLSPPTDGSLADGKWEGYPAKKMELTGGTDQPSYSQGGRVTITGSGVPTTTVTATLKSTPITLGTTTVNADGTFSLIAKLPGSATPGSHHIELSSTFAATSFTHTISVTITSPPPPPPPPASRVCPPSPFSDVTSANTHCEDIAWLKKQHITTPADGMYHPSRPVTRGAMTAFLFRLANPGQPSPTCDARPFPDVDAGYVFCGDIQWAAERGVTLGYPDGTFGPADPVTRGMMAAFLYRATVGGTAPACTAKPFPDVPVDGPFCGAITWMKDHHVTRGNNDGRYGVATVTTRQAMASFLHRIDEIS